jgi:hypothetical protein
MKSRFGFLIALLLFLATAQGQTWQLGLRLGATANSWQVSNTFAYPEVNNNTVGISGTLAPETATYQYRWGVDFGLAVKYEISAPWHVLSGLYFSQKNLASAIERSATQITETIALEMSTYHIQIPVRVGYAINTGKNQKLIPQIGGYLSAGLGGDYTAQIEVQEYTGELPGIESRTELGAVNYVNSINDQNATEYVFSNTYFLNRIDFGLQLGGSYIFKDFFVSAYYSVGIVDTDPVILIFNQNNVTNRYNRTLTLAVGYFF